MEGHSSEEHSAQIGRVTILPLYIDEEFETDAMVTALLPWQAPSLLGAAGSYKSTPTEKSIIISYEWPISHFISESGVSKSELERYHIEKFRTDHLLLGGGLLLPALQQTRENEDPPDFTFFSQGEKEGLDCVQLALQTRRRIWAMFRVIREAIRREARERFAHLTGHVVYMWFHESDARRIPRNPPRSINVEELARILDAMSEYRIDPDAFTFDPAETDGALPEHLETVKFADDIPGLTFYAMPLQHCVPETLFFLLNGFELGLAYSTSTPFSAIRSDLTDVLLAHDKPESPNILVTVGGPDRYGFTYPSEQYLVERALSESLELPTFTNLRTVTVHFWATGRIQSLLPQRASSQELFPGQYSPAAYHANVTFESQRNMRYEWFTLGGDIDSPAAPRPSV